VALGPIGRWVGAGCGIGSHQGTDWVPPRPIGAWARNRSMGCPTWTSAWGGPPCPPGCSVMGRVLRSGHPWVPGVNCEVNPNDCASNPCVHGVCQDGVDRYDCVCQPGFTGGCPWVLGWGVTVTTGCSHGCWRSSVSTECSYGCLGGLWCSLGAPMSSGGSQCWVPTLITHHGCSCWVLLLGPPVDHL